MDHLSQIGYAGLNDDMSEVFTLVANNHKRETNALTGVVNA
jgi:hypothetical protein